MQRAFFVGSLLFQSFKSSNKSFFSSKRLFVTIMAERTLTKTKKLWLGDTYLFSTQAKVVFSGEEESGHNYVVLDETIFHPQGGGQPADLGVIKGDGIEFQVTGLKVVGNEVFHDGTYAPVDKKFIPGQQVSVEIDQKLREQHARCHTAGHLLDACLSSLGTEVKGEKELVPGKGSHFPGNCWVEYNAVVPENLREGLRAALEEEMKKRIDQELPVSVENMEYGKALDLLGFLPSFLPKDEPVRVVSVDGECCGCGGTHLKNIKELKEVKVTKVKKNKKATRVYYEVIG